MTLASRFAASASGSLISRPALSARSFAGAAVLAASLAATDVARGDTILQLYSDSLTTYLPSSATAGQSIRPIHQQRGVGIDGLQRLGGGHGLRWRGTPSGMPCRPIAASAT